MNNKIKEFQESVKIIKKVNLQPHQQEYKQLLNMALNKDEEVKASQVKDLISSLINVYDKLTRDENYIEIHQNIINILDRE